MQVQRTIELHAPVEEVWKLIAKFGDLAEWHPAAMASVVSQQGDATIRTTTIVDGAKMVEMLEDQDDATTCMSCVMLDGPLPVSDFHARISISPSDMGSAVTWTCDFNPIGGTSDDQAGCVIGAYVDAGLSGLKTRFH